MACLMLCRLMASKGIATTGRVGLSKQLAPTSASQSQLILMDRSQTSGQGHLFAAAGAARAIYTESSLKLDSLDSLRQDKSRIFDSSKERYIERVKSYLEKGEIQSVVKEDLVNIIGLAQTEQHLDLIEQIIASHELKETLTNGPWGSFVMRLYYRFNDLDRAYRVIKDTERFGDFFMQYAAFRVAMTMLYKAARYEDVLDIYKIASEKLGANNLYRQRQLDALAIATCAKMTTPESFSIAESIYTKAANNEMRHLNSRMESFFVHLAINVNEPAKALNYLNGSKLRGSIYLPSISLKIMALLKLARYEDIIFCLREAMQLAKEAQKILSQDLVDMIRESKDNVEDDSTRQELMDMLVESKDRNLIDGRPLEAIIFTEIETREGLPPPRPYSQQPRQYQDRQARDHQDRQARDYQDRQARGYQDRQARDYQERGPRQYQDRQARDYQERGPRHHQENHSRRNQRQTAKQYFEDGDEEDMDDLEEPNQRMDRLRPRK